MKSIAGAEFTHLGNRTTFNRTLRHIVSVTSLVEAVSKGANLADLLFDMVNQGQLERAQVDPIVSAICINKFGLPFRSYNMPKSLTEFGSITEKTAAWNALNFISLYHQPNVGTVPINPANPNHWDEVHDLKENELLVVYCQHKKGKKEIAEAGLAAFFALLEGQSPEEKAEFQEAQAVAAPPRKAARPKGKRNLTPKYSVQVTNELFHNGNVEAWKNIIEAYEATHPTCDVIVYHEGELIQDLNSLFKWGKVKHGGVIFFQIAGTEIKGVSRLQKYLHEGASPRFEAFLKHDVNKILNLF